jgi:CDP-diacylglycerol--glycerol-3-phosphate 3-phosphatidyltransferase
MTSAHPAEQPSVERRKEKQWDTLSDWARAQAAALLVPAVQVLERCGIHPDTLTISGTLLLVGVGVIFALGYIALGGWLVLVVAPMDVLDGALARALGKESRFGAFLDSTLDRISDAALILGLTAHYLRQDAHYVEVALLLVSLVGVMMISYTRARAEALGFPCKIGLLTRLERILIIGVLTAAKLPRVMIWTLAILSVFTVIQRILYVYRISRLDERSG